MTSIESKGFQLDLNMLVILRSRYFDTAKPVAVYYA